MRQHDQTMTDPSTLSKEQLIQLLETQQTELQKKDSIIVQLEEKSAAWEAAYHKVWHERFSARSERYIADPSQLRLDFGDTDEACDAASGLGDALEEADLIPAHLRRKPKKKRDESLPANLPRYEVTAELFEAEKTCPDHGQKTLLPQSMWDRTETLEFERPKLKVRVTLYPKYVCENQPQCGVASPERPTGIVEGNKYDASVAAEIITGKWGYHLPIYRQQDYFAGCGWTPGRSTMLNITTQSHFVVEPLLAYFRDQVLTDSIVGCDDTSVTLLYPKTLPEFDLNDSKQRRIHEVFTQALNENKPSIRAKMWAYRGVNVKLNVFDFTVSRHRDGPQWFFADYEGILLGDCWHGFQTIATDSAGKIVRAACNAHARRKIRESTSYPADRLRWLDWYQQLYDIEDRGQSLSCTKRLELRQSESQPIWNEIALWLEQVETRTSNVILPKSDFGKAIQYIRNHLTELQRYLTNSSLPMDNNLTEQLMKQTAIGRKNWMFAGSVAAGERSAGFMTLVSSALRNNLDVWLYLKDVLQQLLNGETDYEPMLPWNWAKQHPEAIRQYRVEERSQINDRKRNHRERRRKRKVPKKRH